MEGEYQGPGWDRPCPRLGPNGGPTCEHSAGDHREDGACVRCAESPAASMRPCATPVPERERGLDPILRLIDRDVRLIRRGSSKLICGKLVFADKNTIVLEPIGEPVRHAYNGGEYPRDEIENIALVQDSWREGREGQPPPIM